jgi:hypothetical protein
LETAQQGRVAFKLATAFMRAFLRAAKKPVDLIDLCGREDFVAAVTALVLSVCSKPIDDEGEGANPPQATA